MSTGHQANEAQLVRDGGDQPVAKTEANNGAIQGAAAHTWGPGGGADRQSYSAAASERKSAEQNKLTNSGILNSMSISGDNAKGGAENAAAAEQYADSGRIRNDAVPGRHHGHSVPVNLVGGTGDGDGHKLKRYVPDGKPVPYPATLDNYDQSEAQGKAAVKQRARADCAKHGATHFEAYSQGAQALHEGLQELAARGELKGCKITGNSYGRPDNRNGILRLLGKIEPRLEPTGDPDKPLPKNWRVKDYGNKGDTVFKAATDFFEGLAGLDHHYLDSYGEQIRKNNARRPRSK